jgi:hypothetical protein
MPRALYTDFPDALVNTSLPTILVSCKCDNPENARQIDVASMESACLSCVEAVKTASNVPESARLCLSSMLRAIMAYRNGRSRLSYANICHCLLLNIFPQDEA